MKTALRFCAASFILSGFLLEGFKDFFLTHPWPAAFFIALGAFSGIFIFGALLYHWFKTPFLNSAWKVFWFFALLFVYEMIGPLIFYVVVYEMKKFTKPEARKTSKASS